jgi:uncharacterized protein (TIGR00369 family)
VSVLKQEQIKNLASKCEYYNLLGMEILDIGDGYIRFTFKDKAKLRNLSGKAVHGGAICSILDAAACLALDTLLPLDVLAVTVNIQVDFLMPLGVGKEVFAEGRVVRLGNNLSVSEAKLVDSEDNIIAKAITTLVQMTMS